MVSAVGLCSAAVLLGLVLRDEMRRRRAGVNGVVRLDVQKSIAVSLTLCLALAGFALAGLVSMQTPARPDLAVDPAAALSAYLVPLVFIGVNLVLVALSIYCHVQREAINREITAASRRDRRAGDRAEAPTC